MSNDLFFGGPKNIKSIVSGKSIGFPEAVRQRYIGSRYEILLPI